MASMIITEFDIFQAHMASGKTKHFVCDKPDLEKDEEFSQVIKIEDHPVAAFKIEGIINVAHVESFEKIETDRPVEMHNTMSLGEEK